MKPFAIFVIIAVVFLLIAGCTEEKPVPEAAQYIGLTYDCSSGTCYYRNLTSNPITPTLTPVPTPTPLQTPEYVMCSDYSKVTDKYKTVKGFYVVTENKTRSISERNYMNTSIGDYVTDVLICDPGYFCWKDYDVLGEPINIIPVTEAESGYREACKVVRK